ncbi:MULTISPECIES: hypothetical protein [Burkholderia cepacia complex]|uniref:Uncharacterized protein n=1 Tax=Burkholderia orbicola (strain AU 1054) TaxID=331271 RepID=A0A0H2XP82_BURO1|nr:MULTISPECIES: hypothetical protein [Burkholderia cepacia complex]ABK08074.1 conserved hypothetical protein [Burkholderia cenocepacia HI2424]MBJ9876817.1 hypothetical protein [Burkholderia cenocepacia]MDN7954436.1 hypothetical protein [Burkholderia orbicola]PNO76315.1 hypothetical protein DK10_005100 [Burkholderia cenocepacia]QIY40666.1 hypothetical protein FOC28_12940 [Burkholderia cenocepacia]
MMKRPLSERMEILDALVADTGLADELTAKQRAKLDARRAELARELKALPNPERELSASAKETTRTEVDFIKAEMAYRDAERAMVEARTRHVVTSQMHEGKRQRILTELERTAPPEVGEALDELSSADDLLRAAVRTDVFTEKNWLGARVGNVTTNMPQIKAARAKIAEAQRDVRALVHDGAIPRDELVSRARMLVDAALEPLFSFVSRQKWETRRSRPHSDLLAEVAGYGD